MRIKKYIAFVLLLIIGSVAGLYGCGNKYANLSVEIDREEITVFLNEEEEDTDSFNATVTGMAKGVSSEVNYIDSNPSVVKIEKGNSADGVTAFTVTALKGGSTTITVVTKEGDKRASVVVNVVERITDMTYNTSYKPYVVKGSSTSLNSTQALVFTPSTTTQKNVSYSLKSAVDGISITSQGVLSALSTVTAQTVRVVVENLDAEFSVEFDVKIIHPINLADIEVTSNGEAVESITLATNRAIESSKDLDIDVMTSEAYNIEYSVQNSNVAELIKLNSQQINIQSGIAGTTSLQIKVSIVGYPAYFVTKTISISVLELPNWVSVNGDISNRTMEIYDTYTNNLGQQLTLQVGATGAFNKQIKLGLAEEDRSKITIRYADGSLVDIDNDILDNNTTIFVKVNENYTLTENDLAVLDVIAYGTENRISSEVKTSLSLNLRKGITNIDISSKFYVSVGKVAYLPFSIIAGEYSQNYFIEVLNTNILSAEETLSYDDRTISLTGLAEGTTTLTIYASNGYKKTVTIYVFIEINVVSLVTDSPSANSNIGEAIYQEKVYESYSYYSLSTIAVARSSALDITLIRYVASADGLLKLNSGNFAEILFTSSDSSIVAVSNAGHLVAKKQGTVTINCVVSVYTTSGVVEVDLGNVAVTVFIPVSTISLNTTNLTLYAVNSLGYFEKAEAEKTLKLSVNPTNASFDTSSISWTCGNNLTGTTESNNMNLKLSASLLSGVSNYSSYVTVVVTQYKKTFILKCTVTIKAAVKVADISNVSYTINESTKTLNSDYVDANSMKHYTLYLDSRDVYTTQSIKLNASVFPTSATNQNLIFKTTKLDSVPSQVISISNDGTLTILRAGICKILIIAEDSYTSEENYLVYADITLIYADGNSEELALHISSLSDLLKVNTEAGLDKFYVLTTNIDASSISCWQSIGIIDGENIGFSGTINGRYEANGEVNNFVISGLKFVSNNSNIENTFGLFSKLKNGGEIKNLTVSVQRINLNLTNYDETSSLNFGVIAAENELNNLTNCSVILPNSYNSSIITLATTNASIGGLFGVNLSGNAEKCMVQGYLKVVKSANSLSSSNTFVGGLFGVNNGELDGGFNYNDGEVIYNFDGVNSLVNFTMCQLDGGNEIYNNTFGIIALGGVVGYNNGTIENYSSGATLVGIDNVGGVVGLSEGDIINCFSASVVNGYNYVGGIAGKQAGEISYCIVNFLDWLDYSYTGEIAPSLTGTKNVGGLAGFASGEINYSYVKTYYNRTGNYLGDIVLKYSISTESVGGLVGSAQNLNILNNYSQAEIISHNRNSNVGGFVGIGSNCQISNSYARGSVKVENNQNSKIGAFIGNSVSDNLIDKTYSTILDVTFVGNGSATTTNSYRLSSSPSLLEEKTENELKDINTFESWSISDDEIENPYNYVWNISNDYNDNYPIIVSNSIPLVVESPVSMSVVVNSSTLESEEDLNQPAHIKITDYSALVYHYENNVEANVLNLNDLVSITLLPSSTKSEFYKVISENVNIINTLNEKLIILNEGVVRLKFTSLLNNSLSCYITINVVKALTNFGLYTDSTLTTLYDTETNVLQLIKGNNKALYLSAGENDNFRIEYQTTSTNNISILNTTWQDNKVNTSSLEMQVVSGVSPVSNATLSVKPYCVALNENGENVVVYLPVQTQDIAVFVYYGISSVSASISDAQITLKDLLNVTLTANSDNPSEVVIQENAIQITLTETDYTGVTDSDIEELLQFSDPQVAYDIVNKTTTFTYQINIVESTLLFDLLSQATTKGRAGIELFVKVAISLENVTKFAGFTVLITPQGVYDINMEFYSRAEKDEEGNYDFNEVPTENIIAGRWGMMKLNLYPANANLEEVTISYSSNSTIAMSMQQMVKLNNELGDYSYTTLLPYSQPLANGRGLSLQFVSNKIVAYDVNLQQVVSYNYDGYLYINFIIQSQTPLNTAFVINVTSRFANGQTLTETLTLYSDVPSEIELSHLGLLDYTYMAVNAEQTINLILSKLEVNTNGSNIVWNLLSNGQNLTKDIDYTVANILTTQNGYLTQASATLKLLNASLIGQELQLTASISKFINNKTETYLSNVLTVFACKYTVDSVTINMQGLDNKTLEQPYGASYALSVKLNITGNDEGISNELIEQIKKNLNNWYAIKNNEADYNVISLGNDVYYNFIFESNDDYIYIRPKYVSTGDVIKCILRLSYNEQGLPEIVNDESDSTNLANYTTGIQANKNVILTDYFVTGFYSNTTSVNASPILTVEDLINMNESESYRLANDITVSTPWVPLNTEIAYLDGNGYTITLEKGFDTIVTTSTSLIGNYGLFGTISSSTKIYNVNVEINNYVYNGTDYTNLNVDLTNSLFTEINFGLIAGINNGIVYNCSAKDISSFNGGEYTLNITTTAGSSGVNAYIGGLIGTNNGYITNSSSNTDYIANRGNTGGLVGYNNGTIASSKVVLDTFINNTSSTELGCLIGGFVAVNATNGRINYCFVEGKAVDTSLSSTNGNNNRFRKTTSSVIGSYNVGGFVNQNSGIIKDSFSNIRVVSQNRSSGFVFNNKGTINNCYTASFITENHTDHTPFTGTATGGSILNTGTITNAYYLSGNLGGTTNEVATPLIVQNNKITKSQFALFVLSQDEIDGIWNFNTESDYSLPTLVDANLTISNYSQYVASTEMGEGNVVTFNWEYGEGNSVGGINNPYVVESAEKFNLAINESSNTSYFRLVSDLTFTDTILPATTNLDFKGVLFGNAMKLNNINLVADENSDVNNFGLFKTIKQSDNAEDAIVKNLILNVNNVYANNITSVGTLAGSIIKSKISDITINGKEAVVQGRHFVGALAGYVEDSLINTVNLEISVNASYRGNETTTANKSSLFTESVNPNATETAVQFKGSYAGTLAGIITGESKALNTNVTGNSRVIGYYAGGIVGLLDTESELTMASIIVEPTQFIRAYVIAGGVVAENRGTISKAFIQQVEAIQLTIDFANSTTNRNLTFFAGSPRIIGGLVGFNYNGTINNSFSKIDVRNTTSNAIMAGGLVGATIDGSINCCYATGSVLNNFILGGLIGSVTTEIMLFSSVEDTEHSISGSFLNSIKAELSNSSITTITNSMAFSNWLSTDYTLVHNALSRGLFVGCVNTGASISTDSLNKNYMQYLSTAETDFNEWWETGVGGISEALNGVSSTTYTVGNVAEYKNNDVSLTLARIRNKNGNYTSIYTNFNTSTWNKSFTTFCFPKIIANINL